MKDEARRSYAAHLPGALDQESGQRFFSTIREQTAWVQPEGRMGPIPRKTAWMVRKGCSCTYRYGGVEVDAIEFPGWMIELLNIVMPACGLKNSAHWPDSCNLNLYEDGGMSVGWHSDDERLFQGKFRDIVIISLSLGVKRKFELKVNWPEQGERSLYKVTLSEGDLMTMEGMLQKHFQHRVPKEDYVSGPRINLTWRWVVKHAPRCGAGHSRRGVGGPPLEISPVPAWRPPVQRRPQEQHEGSKDHGSGSWQSSNSQQGASFAEAAPAGAFAKTPPPPPPPAPPQQAPPPAPTQQETQGMATWTSGFKQEDQYGFNQEQMYGATASTPALASSQMAPSMGMSQALPASSSALPGSSFEAASACAAPGFTSTEALQSYPASSPTFQVMQGCPGATMPSFQAAPCQAGFQGMAGYGMAAGQMMSPCGTSGMLMQSDPALVMMQLQQQQALALQQQQALALQQQMALRMALQAALIQQAGLGLGG